MDLQSLYNSRLQAEDSTENPESGYTPYDERLATYIISIVLFIIFIVGLLGNGTLVIIFIKHRAMRTVPNTYILSLALGDLLVIITCVPFASVKPSTVLFAALIWILAVICALPDAISADFMYVQIEDNFTIAICTPYPNIMYGLEYAKFMVVAKALVYYILPLCVIACFYILMAKRLHATARDMPGELQTEQGITQAMARKNLARMVLAFIIVFFVCFFPFHLVTLWFYWNPNALEDDNDFWQALTTIGDCLSFINSCVNPVTLYCVSGVFRQHFNHYLCCRGLRQL